MLASSLFALLLLAIAMRLAAALGRERQSHEEIARTDSQKRSEAAVRFARRRFTRRNVANTSIGLAAVLLASWQIVPREPLWVAAYLATLSSLTLLILTLGMLDAVASRRHYHSESRRRLAEQTEALVAEIEALRSERRPS